MNFMGAFFEESSGGMDSTEQFCAQPVRFEAP